MVQTTQPPKLEYSDMTTNERLYAAGLLDEFDKAVRSGDRDAMIEILTAVELREQAVTIADARIVSPNALRPLFERGVRTITHDGGTMAERRERWGNSLHRDWQTREP